MSAWHASGARQFLYRAVIKARVESEKRVGPAIGVKRLLASFSRRNLAWLAAVYGSDKGATAHQYVDLYEAHFRARRSDVRKVLEIGIYKGASLQMWRDYFPNAEVIGLDIESITTPGPRVSTVQGDQSDPELLARLRAMGPFDLIIDDGSHIAEHVRATFAGLFQSVVPGGTYVIEDMQTAYMPSYGGGAPGEAVTAISLVQDLLHDVHREYVAEKFPESAEAMRKIKSVHVYPKIAFIDVDQS